MAVLSIASTTNLIFLFPASAAPSQQTLKFPPDKSVGIVFESVMKSPWEESFDKKLANARGEVKLPAGTKLHLQINFVGGEDLSWLAKFKPDDFVSIDLRTTPVTDDQLKYVGRLTGTRILHLNDTDVTDAGLLALSKLSQLRYLGMTKTSIKGTGLKALCPSLNYLDMAHNDLSDSVMANLKQLTDLRVLNLGFTGIGDGALIDLGTLKSLSILDISNNRKIDDGGILHLLTLPNLNTLVLFDTRVTVKGLLQLKKIKTLGTLKLSPSLYTQAQLQEVKKAMPKVWLRADASAGPENSTRIIRTIALSEPAAGMQSL